ncbi:MAG: acyltransferase [Bacteroidales bacterium]|nr:acyltransferase [Bacteroidales bacterium]
MIRKIIHLVSRLWFFLRYPVLFCSGRIKSKGTVWNLGCRFLIDKGNDVVLENAYISRSRFVCRGESNTITCNGHVYKTKMFISGKGNRIVIQDGAKVYNTTITLRAEKSEITIGRNTNTGSLYAVCMGKDNYIRIGESCMISDNVEIWSTDGHSISDKVTGELLNTSKPVVIGNRVWLGKNSVILKGVEVKDGTIVGMNSVVTKDTEPFSVVAGNPAKTVRNNVKWSGYYTKD